MGYTRHHAIIVTGFDANVSSVRNFCKDLGATVSELVASPINRWKSFLVVPDGSKEGWAESDEGDKQRIAIVQYLTSLRYEDGSSLLDWIEVQYGDTDGESAIIRHSNEEIVT